VVTPGRTCMQSEVGMDAFLEAVNQPVVSDFVRRLVARYELVETKGDDYSDEGLPQEYYLQSKAHGVAIRYYEAGLVKTVYLYSGGLEGFCRFRGSLTDGVTFKSCRVDVVRALGKPSRSAPPGAVPILGPHGGWDCYDKEMHSIHFSYLAHTMMLRLVTIMAPDTILRIRGE
jgi:hypothetical protein